jgi:hypothetical protein
LTSGELTQDGRRDPKTDKMRLLSSRKDSRIATFGEP